MFGPMPSWSWTWPIVRIFGERIPDPVSQPAQGMINALQRIVLAAALEKGDAPQQAAGDEPFYHVTAICSNSCLFRRIPASKFSIEKFSFGECALQSGNAKPSNRVSMPRTSLNDWVIGILPPSRIKATGFPTVSANAFWAAFPKAESGLTRYVFPECCLRISISTESGHSRFKNS